MHSYYVNQEIARQHYAELVREGAQEALARKTEVEETPPKRQLTWARKRLALLRPALRPF
jgi:hypothetical protein